MKNTNRFYKPFALAICLALLIYSVAYAASGGLDTTFNGDGKIIQGFGGTNHRGQDVAVQSDGKVVVVGLRVLNGNKDFAIARYNVDGSLDKTFSGDGLQVIDFGATEDRSYSVAIQGDGKIVVNGETCPSFCDVALVRLNPNGTLDTTFGTGGKVITDFGADDNGSYDLALLNGKIVVGGYLYNAASSSYDAAVYQYTSAGKLDPTFSGDGVLPMNWGQSETYYAITVYSGKIYAAGDYNYGSTSDFIAARINPNGTLDTTFGTGGKVRTNLGAQDDTGKGGIAISGGKVIVVGTSDNNAAIMQYTASGTLDPTFHGNGKLKTNLGFAGPSLMSVTVQGSKIIVAGNTDGSDSANALVARFTPAGILDSTFGVGGIVTTNWGGADTYWSVLFRNARIYVVGNSLTSTANRFTIAAYLP